MLRLFVLNKLKGLLNNDPWKLFFIFIFFINIITIFNTESVLASILLIIFFFMLLQLSELIKNYFNSNKKSQSKNYVPVFSLIMKNIFDIKKKLNNKYLDLLIISKLVFFVNNFFLIWIKLSKKSNYCLFFLPKFLLNNIKKLQKLCNDNAFNKNNLLN